MTNTEISLSAKTRQETGKKVKSIREQGNIPAVLYGHNIEPKNLSIKYTDFDRVYKVAGESTLIDLSIDEGATVKVLVQDHQLDPRINHFLHVDLLQVNMKEKIHTEIPIKFTGVAPAVKSYAAVMVTSLDKFQVECLPDALVNEIEVDLSSLKEFDDAIHVGAIKAPEGITIQNGEEDVVVLVQAPRVEKVEEPVVAEGAEGEAPADGDKPAEGDAPADGDKPAEEKK